MRQLQRRNTGEDQADTEKACACRGVAIDQNAIEEGPRRADPDPHCVRRPHGEFPQRQPRSIDSSLIPGSLQFNPLMKDQR